MKCPFRKKTYFMAGSKEHSWNTTATLAEFMEEEFCDCIDNECMAHYKPFCTEHNSCKLMEKK